MHIFYYTTLYFLYYAKTCYSRKIIIKYEFIILCYLETALYYNSIIGRYVLLFKIFSKYISPKKFFLKIIY